MTLLRPGPAIPSYPPLNSWYPLRPKTTFPSELAPPDFSPFQIPPFLGAQMYLTPLSNHQPNWSVTEFCPLFETLCFCHPLFHYSHHHPTELRQQAPNQPPSEADSQQTTPFTHTHTRSACIQKQESKVLRLRCEASIQSSALEAFTTLPTPPPPARRNQYQPSLLVLSLNSSLKQLPSPRSSHLLPVYIASRVSKLFSPLVFSRFYCF